MKRSRPKHTKWCAPEVENFQHNDRSDLWTLACMIQLMLNVSDLEADKLDWALETLKTSPHTFFPISNRQTEDADAFVNTLQLMLHRDSEARITLEELMQIPIVRKILSQSNSESLARAKRCLINPNSRPVPSKEGERAVRDYLLYNWQHERCAEEAVVWFSENVCHEKSWLPPHLANVLFNVLRLHKLNTRIVRSAFDVLRHASNLGHAVTHLLLTETQYEIRNDEHVHAQDGDIFQVSENEELTIILQAMKQHALDATIQKSGLQLFDSLLGSSHANITIEVAQTYLQTHRHVFEYLRKIGLTEHILQLLQSHQFELAYLGVEYLWKWCIYDRNAQLVANSNALDVVFYLMRNYPGEILLFNGGPLLLLALSFLESAQKHIMACDDIVFILLGGLKRFVSCPDTLWNICLGLNTVINLSEHFALHFVGIENETLFQNDGFEVLYTVYKLYHDNTYVLEALMRVCTAVLQYDDIVDARLKSNSATHVMLREVAIRFKHHEVAG